MFGVGVSYLLFDRRIAPVLPASGWSWPRIILGLQAGLILLAMVVTRSSVASIQAKQGLPIGNQVVGWLVLGTHEETILRELANKAVASFALPFAHSLFPRTHYLHRLVVVFLTFAPTFVILTISYEGLFYFTFCATLNAWVRLEHHIYTWRTDASPPSLPPLPTPKPLHQAVTDVTAQLTTPEYDGASYRSLRLSDPRISLFFFFFLQSAFFSTGNIASISSFSLDSVYRLIPVFSPFSQGALLLLKLLIPFAVISVHLGLLNRRLGVAPSALFMIVMAVSDVLTLNFFWLVRDEGSWLEIGTSISHFGICSLLCAFVATLELLSEIFVGGVEVGGATPHESSNGHALQDRKHVNETLRAS